MKVAVHCAKGGRQTAALVLRDSKRLYKIGQLANLAKLHVCELLKFQ